MRIRILGPLQVRAGDGRPVEVGGTRLRLLLIRLALDPGRLVTAERLIDDLWDGEPPVDPAGALQSLVARLRRALGEDRGLIASHPAGYRLDLPPDTVDAEAFERAGAEARAALSAGEPARAVAVLDEALALWRGTPLADAAGAAFAAAPAARLEELRLSMVEDRIDAALAAGVPVPVAEVEASAAAHPTRERLQARLMRVLCAAGRRADALEAYERVRHALADGLGVDPGPELRGAHRAALREEAASRPGALPARSTRFIGRDRELTGVRAALEDARLVTLTGFGGTGKTRLAVEVADGWPEPVRMVELGAVTAPGGVAPAVMSAVDDGEAGAFGAFASADPLDRLVAALAGRRLLLLLDNCEHIVDAAAELAERLLAAAPEVRILATSREPLAIAGESLYPVAPLGLPEPGTDPRQAPAVSLFADRAAAVRPGFAVTDDIVRVCRELDGIPLAIELAAARLRSLTADQLAERIGDRFRLLDHGRRSALPRHRTLRAVVDWSWDLLDEAEQALLRRMSVFVGGADAGAVRRVCAPGGDVVEALAGLVDKSLVIAVADGTSVRYRLLETVREYAAGRLEEAGETAAVTRAHGAYYLELAETAEPLLRGRDQLVWLARLDADQGNLDAALGQAVASGLAETALRMVVARVWPWVLRGGWRQVGEWASRVLDAAGPEPPPGCETAHAICVLIASSDGAPFGVRQVTPALGRALRVIERSDHPAAFAAWALAGGHAGEAPGDRLGALVERFGGHADPWLRAMTRLVEGIVEFEWTAGGAARAEAHVRAALDLFDEVGDRWGQAFCLYELALILANRGSWADAASALERARARAAEIGAVEEIPAPMMLLVQLGQARARAGDHTGARTDLERALTAADRGGDALGRARVRGALGELALLGGDLDEAARWLRDALAIAPERAPAQFVALLRGVLARAETARGDSGAARVLHAEALGLMAGTGDDVARATAVEHAAAWCLDQGDAECAATVLSAARTLRGIDETDDPWIRELLGRCAAALGEARLHAAWERGRVLSRPEDLLLQAMERR
ncbi:BTAD domain-containing putative transcriptional regulator [Actinoallomurus vinaceus]|uniref:BTAD domain-containing putative transcriptional regulator n=1 Tax=Actinoallomurus vinaceus TaxID=1080074 RepID=A0ABP8UNC9_9ACTN